MEREKQVQGSICGGGRAVADYVEGDDVPAVRWNCGGGDDVVAGEDRRTTQLGLSLLLAARYCVHAADTDPCGLCGGGGRVAEVAAAGCGPGAGPGGEAVRDKRRGAACWV